MGVMGDGEARGGGAGPKLTVGSEQQHGSPWFWVAEAGHHLPCCGRAVSPASLSEAVRMSP